MYYPWIRGSAYIYIYVYSNLYYTYICVWLHCAYPVIFICCPVLVVSCLCCMHGMWSWTVRPWGCDIVFTYFLLLCLFLQWSQAGHWSLRCAYCSIKVEKRNMNTWAWQHRHTVHNHVPHAKTQKTSYIQHVRVMWYVYNEKNKLEYQYIYSSAVNKVKKKNF
jgi:hypothetical protein